MPDLSTEKKKKKKAVTSSVANRSKRKASKLSTQKKPKQRKCHAILTQILIYLNFYQSKYQRMSVYQNPWQWKTFNPQITIYPCSRIFIYPSPNGNHESTFTHPPSLPELIIYPQIHPLTWKPTKFHLQRINVYSPSFITLTGHLAAKFIGGHEHPPNSLYPSNLIC